MVLGVLEWRNLANRMRPAKCYAEALQSIYIRVH